MSDRKKIKVWYSVGKMLPACDLGQDLYQREILRFLFSAYNDQYLKNPSDHKITIGINAKDFENVMSPRKFSSTIKELSDLGIVKYDYAGGQGAKIQVSIVTEPVVRAIIRKSITLSAEDVLSADKIDWSLMS